MSWPKPPVSMRSQHEAKRPLPTDYVAKRKAMSSKAVVVDLFWKEKKQFAFTVNEHVFNPVMSIACHKLVELILSDTINVTDKSVVDLGCGSGVVGLCAIARKARKVLFTDINPHIDGIQKHPMFRACDDWQVQDVMADVPDESYEMALVLPPAMVAREGQSISADTFESGTFRPSAFYKQVLTDAGRVLKAKGQLVMWLRIPLQSFHSFIGFVGLAADKFDLKSATLLAHGVESLICADHETSSLARWMYKVQKGGVSNDGLWMFLSLTRHACEVSPRRLSTPLMEAAADSM